MTILLSALVCLLSSFLCYALGLIQGYASASARALHAARRRRQAALDRANEASRKASARAEAQEFRPYIPWTAYRDELTRNRSRN